MNSSILYSTTSSASSSTVFSIISIVLAIVATVLAFIFIVPGKKREKLNSFGKFIHDTCNFKYLIVEKLIQALYIFLTSYVIISGFFLLFRTSFGVWLGGLGLLLMILGPIAIRLVYELLMMTVILVKNVIEINNKLKNNNESASSSNVFSTPDLSSVRKNIANAIQKPETPAAPAAPSAQAENKPHFCINCGSPLNDDGSCPNCSK